MSEQIELALRLGRGREQGMQILRKDVLPIGDGLEALAIGILQAEHHADADLFVGPHDRVEVPVLERVERQHVLNGGHARAQALERAEQGAGADLLHRAGRILRRQRIEAPGLERHLLQCAFGQHVVRVVMGVDEAGQDEMAAPVELVDRRAGNGRKARRDADDGVAGDGDVAGLRLVPIAGGQHRPAAADDQRGAVRDRVERHCSGCLNAKAAWRPARV